MSVDKEILATIEQLFLYKNSTHK